MSLLFDQNLSFKLCAHLDDLFSESAHVRSIYQCGKTGLSQSELAHRIGHDAVCDFAIGDADYDGHSLAMLNRTAASSRTPGRNPFRAPLSPAQAV